MKIGPFVIGKDGGKDSTVDGVMFEIKSLFSVGILRFKDGSREAWHSHAFNCWSLVLRGLLVEYLLDGADWARDLGRPHFSGDVIETRRTDIHKVMSLGTSYVLTFRGPWKKSWVDVRDLRDGAWAVDTLTDGRVTETSKVFATRRQAAKYAREIA